jgi:hypothetical protein
VTQREPKTKFQTKLPLVFEKQVQLYLQTYKNDYICTNYCASSSKRPYEDEVPVKLTILGVFYILSRKVQHQTVISAKGE